PLQGRLTKRERKTIAKEEEEIKIKSRAERRERQRENKAAKIERLVREIQEQQEMIPDNEDEDEKEVLFWYRAENGHAAKLFMENQASQMSRKTYGPTDIF